MKLVSHEKLAKGSSNDYETPPELYKKLHKVFKFDLDVAAQKETAKCKRWLGPGSKLAEDALTVSWDDFGETCWCNPPYNRWAEFACKAVHCDCLTAMLVPPRTDSRAFHEYMPLASEITFLEGRVSFLLDKNIMSSPGAGSIVAIFSPGQSQPLMKFWNWKNDPYPL